MTNSERSPREPGIAGAIREAIRAGGRTGRDMDGRERRCISFRDYMAICLYDPAYGYYRGPEKVRVGREGDFYTSSYIGDVLGERLGAYARGLAAERFGRAETVELVDWGGGTGRLAKQMLGGWNAAAEAAGAGETGTGEAGAAAFEGPRVRVTVVDDDPAHRREAETRLAAEIAAGAARVLSAAEAEAQPWRERPVVVVANELLDAMPVHRVVLRGGRLREWAVAWDDESGRPVPCAAEPSTPRLAETMARSGIRLREGQTAEIGLEAADWIASLAGKLGRAIVAVVDYGDEAEELTAGHRMAGTLLCYRRHVASGDPFEAPGEQDITAHVDFTSVRAAAEAAGWSALWYGTQKRFLVEAGVLERLAEHAFADPFHPVARTNRAIRQLLLSDGMSELFKVLVLAKG
ncbi:SAM-dependent methyltransferase [Cohnella xylanilytica]|uniref:class I SAM-dependent methyltransferase n=1 Tax=Cohnella xylanilytica TaxID=557555 RepID=UPI001B01FB8E|nr:SAM-dependent methyltransferase [Cohnella xylanilytica]GIO13336.1 SAM-dependent methyltransferase [Cohnella xylanilytica]